MLELLSWRPKAPVDFFPQGVNLKKEQKGGAILVSHSMAGALVSVWLDVRHVQEHQVTAVLSQSSLGPQELCTVFGES